MSNWRKNKAAAVTMDNTPSLTDQSQARETDINVIVAKMGITGTVPGNKQQPMYGDFTEYPSDLRGFLETARSLDQLRKELPEQLQKLSTQQMIAMGPEAVAELLKPATPPADKPKEG